VSNLVGNWYVLFRGDKYPEGDEFCNSASVYLLKEETMKKKKNIFDPEFKQIP